MILGMKYLRLKHISIISKDFPSGNNYKIKADKRLLIDANSELVIWGQLPKYLSVGHFMTIFRSNYFHLKKMFIIFFFNIR
jgi:hypothetical protein